MFILLAYFSDEIVNIVLTIGGTPYQWIMDSDLPPLQFADFNSVMLTIIGVCANGAVALITLVLVMILAWNYLKLLFEAAERYVLLGVLVYTAPVAFSMGASQTTSNIWKSWCRMLGGQIFPFAYERLVPAAVYFYGRSFHSQSAFTVKEAHY